MDAKTMTVRDLLAALDVLPISLDTPLYIPISREVYEGGDSYVETTRHRLVKVKRKCMSRKIEVHLVIEQED